MGSSDPADGERAGRLPAAHTARRVAAVCAVLLGLACGGYTGWRNGWAADGTLDVEKTGLYEGGTRIVPRDDRLLYPNGRRGAMGVTLHGRPDGYWIYWHDNGQRAAEGLWKHGVREGQWVHFHEDGHKRSEGTFEKGAKVGVWTFWREDGSLDTLRSGEYRDDRRTGG